MPAILAFDTSTERLAVGVATTAGEHLVDESAGGALASTQLLPRVHALLARAGLAPSALDAIAFGRGPGAFTGLRTSCAVAQGLAFGLDRPVLPIDSLLIVAEDAAAQTAPGDAALEVAVAMDARMGEIYAGRWRRDGGTWHALEAPGLYTRGALGAAWQGRTPDVLAGSALELPEPDAAAPTNWPPARHRVPRERARASALLRLALQAHAAGAGIDAAQALPLYLRDKVALTTAERQAARHEAAPRAEAQP